MKPQISSSIQMLESLNRIIDMSEANKHGCRYTSKSIYVDIDTGEIILQKYATNRARYIIIKTNKKIIYNANKTQGTITYTRECKRQPQLNLFS